MHLTPFIMCLFLVVWHFIFFIFLNLAFSCCIQVTQIYERMGDSVLKECCKEFYLRVSKDDEMPSFRESFSTVSHMSWLQKYTQRVSIISYITSSQHILFWLTVTLVCIVIMHFSTRCLLVCVCEFSISLSLLNVHLNYFIYFLQRYGVVQLTTLNFALQVFHSYAVFIVCGTSNSQKKIGIVGSIIGKERWSLIKSMRNYKK
jgi:hypothetical protein